MEPRFCFKISEKAALAHGENGEPASFYSEIHFEGGRLLSSEEYERSHEKLRVHISDDWEIPEHYVEAISPEEYERCTKEEDEVGDR